MDGVFKKSVLGFKQSQVLTYIEQLNKENEALTADLMGKISSMEGQNTALLAENTQIKSQLAKLDEELYDSKQLQSQLSDRLVVLTNQLNEQKAKLFQSKSDNVKIQSDNELLTREVELYKEKLSVYEEKEQQISNALIDAKQMAKQLVEEGRRSGEAERVRILNSINGLELELGDFSRDLAVVRDEICTITENFLNQLDQLGSTVQVYQSQLGVLSKKVQREIDIDSRIERDPVTAKPLVEPAPVQQAERITAEEAPVQQEMPKVRPTLQQTKKSAPASTLIRSIQKLLNNL